MGASVDFETTETDHMTLTGVLGTNDTFSFTTWINYETLPSSSRPVVAGIAATSGQAVFLTNTTVCLLGVAFRFIKWTHAFTTGTWYHLAWTYDGSGNMLTGSTAYVDGVSQTLVDHSNGTGDPGTLGAIDLIALRNSGSGDKMDGLLAYLTMHDIELTEAEVQELRFKPGSVVRGLQGYWPLIGAATDWVKDHSGNGNDATNVNTPVASQSGPPVHFPKLKKG